MKNSLGFILLNLCVLGSAAAQQPLYSKTFQLSDLTRQGQQYQLDLAPGLSAELAQPVIVRVQGQLKGEGSYHSQQQAECSYLQQGACQGQTRPVAKNLYQFELNALVSCGSREVLDKTLFDGEYTDVAIPAPQSAMVLDEATLVLAPADCGQLKLVFNLLQAKTLQGLEGRIEILPHSSEPGLTITEVR